MAPEGAGPPTSGGAAVATPPTTDWGSPIQAARSVFRTGTDLFLCARPGWPWPSFAEQAKSTYRRLFATLREEGARPCDLVAEKVFLSDIKSQLSTLQTIRQDFYKSISSSEDLFPASTFVQQPPARRGQLCEIQAIATLAPEDGGAPQSRSLHGLPPGLSGRIVETGGLRHIHLSNVTGGSFSDTTGIRQQTASMFERAEACLHREGFSFRDVVRTWIYLCEMGADYDALNVARTRFFTLRGVQPPPASTGIQGLLHPPDRRCALDLRAVSGPGRHQAKPIHSTTMNEAPEYGCSFSRGTRLALEDRTILYLSGTASIDHLGRVAHVGSIEGQVDRMLLNVEDLLAGQGATLQSLVSATTYLKHPAYLVPFLKVCRQHGLPEQVPNTICVAEVCRPEWLCEMEAIAVLT